MPKRSFELLPEKYSRDRIDQVSGMLRTHATDLAREFYEVMLEEPEARIHLDHSKIESRMFAMFDGWAQSVLSDSETFDSDVLLQSHMRIGDVHARVGIPGEQILHGMQIVKSRCFDIYIDKNQDLPVPDLKDGIAYINELFDTCLSVMNVAYLRRTLEDERSAQSLRFRMASTELSVECERMKTELITWTRDLVFKADARSPGLGADVYTSIFGSWLTHKAPMYFGEYVELDSIRGATAHLDEAARQLLDNSENLDEAARMSLLNRVKQIGTEICWHMDRLVERSQQELDSRDTLTRLYGRRFLDSVLKRENQLALGSKDTYSLVMVDIDGFKEINDLHGHLAGDNVLQEVAHVISTIVRQTDFCFRYGGDEILIVMPGSHLEAACARAETLRRAVEELLCTTQDGRPIEVTVSIGCAEFSGHPDYENLIQDVDNAVYQAKAAGKNCVKTNA